MSPAEMTLEVPSRPDFLALVRLIVAAVASEARSLDEPRLNDLRLVVSEVCTNAMEANWRASAERLGVGGDLDRLKAAVRPDPAVVSASDPLSITCVADADRICVEVRDRGSGFDPNRDPHPPVHDPARLDHERGLGIPLIQYLADEVDFAPGEGGTTVRVVLRPR